MNRVVKLVFGFLLLKAIPDNETLPVLRLGRLHHFGNGRFHRVWPLIEEALPPVKTSIRVGHFTFAEMYTADSIPFTVSLTVLFKFDPSSISLPVAAQLVKMPPKIMLNIVQDYSDHALRKLIARFDARDVVTPTSREQIKQEISRYLRLTLQPLGICILPSEGILLKEITPHERYRRNTLSANKWDVMLETLAAYNNSALLDRGIQGAMVDSIENRPGETNLVAPPIWPLYHPLGSAAQSQVRPPSYRPQKGRSDPPFPSPEAGPEG